MAVRIEIPNVHYDKIVDQLPKESQFYSRLKNAFVVSRFSPQGPARILQIYCDDNETDDILKTLKQYCPEVEPNITTGVNL
jgi:patatin-like phospholipase/acyl hydrolase